MFIRVISKGLCPKICDALIVFIEILKRVNEEVRIAVSLNTSVEYLVSGAVQNNIKPIDIICQQLPQIQEHLDSIKEAVKEIQ